LETKQARTRGDVEITLQLVTCM